jgi:RNA polymerase sigma-70 factor (ECF subfamily)
VNELVPSEHFVRELTRGQNSVFAYILSLVGDPDVARDILQDTNDVLWRKAGEFEEGSNFMSWALAVARLEVLAFRRDHHRDRHVFDAQILEQLADEYAASPEDPDDRQRAFEDCLKKLPSRQRELLDARYAPGGSVKEIAERRGQSAGAISVTLSRIRKALANCIDAKINQVSHEH